jgi:Leucine-rich repeat (LRR) protein
LRFGKNISCTLGGSFSPHQSPLSPSLLSPCSLRLVDATENELSLLPPPRAWKSCGLKDLRLNGNRLTHLDLDKCDKFWPQLESLYVGQNNLKEIPKEIGQLRSLSCLDISHNDIRHLPDELGLLDHLFLLNLQGLDKLSLDPTLLRGPTKNITAFLKSRRVKVREEGISENHLDNIVNLVISSDGNASKSAKFLATIKCVCLYICLSVYYLPKEDCTVQHFA